MGRRVLIGRRRADEPGRRPGRDLRPDLDQIARPCLGAELDAAALAAPANRLGGEAENDLPQPLRFAVRIAIARGHGHAQPHPGLGGALLQEPPGQHHGLAQRRAAVLVKGRIDLQRGEVRHLVDACEQLPRGLQDALRVAALAVGERAEAPVGD